MFGQDWAYRSVKRWRKVELRATLRCFTDRTRYDFLVLEMGVDRPGGMADILRVFRPQMAILTGVVGVHLSEGQFADEEAIFEEKARLVRGLSHGAAILNRDDPFCRRLEGEPLNAELLWYGRLISGPSKSLPPGLYFDCLRSSSAGITAKVHVRSAERGPLRAESREVFCPILGEHHIYVLLPAILAGLLSGLDLERSCEPLATFSLPKGRMDLVPGINSCTIINSAWNAAPPAVEAALDSLRACDARRRIALLGSMRELGDASEAAHREVGRVVSESADMLVTVGSEARSIAEEARACGLPDDAIRSFDVAEEAGHYLKGAVRPGDMVLVKGSRLVFLERAIGMFMEDPDGADHLFR
jgi:UDP-N-acetylmuramoyl-tripeptide--D-alanyl-D-alanine ligase